MCHTELEIQWDFDSIPINAQVCYVIMENLGLHLHWRFSVDALKDDGKKQQLET